MNGRVLVDSELILYLGLIGGIVICKDFLKKLFL